MKSTVTKKQVKTFRTDYTNNGRPETLIAHVRYDDDCGNGHNTFSITGELYTQDRQPGESKLVHKSGKTLWCNAGGCLHDEIAKRFPELAEYIKWHLCGPDGPLHYVANTVWHAGDRDCWGLRKGETRQIRNGKTGKPSWILEADKDLPKYVDSKERPTETAMLRYVPWGRIGEGKERNLDAARQTAIWPDATDEELCAPDLKERLEARLPKLMEEFRPAVESLGFAW